MGWLAMAFILSGCGSQEAPGAAGAKPAAVRRDVKAAAKMPGLDASSQSKSQAKTLSTIEGDRMTPRSRESPASTSSTSRE
jgi:hypothetical protein